MKSSPHRRRELALTVCFLAVIFAVPVIQTTLEWWRGERVQFTDVFRQPVTAKNLRQYEKTLEAKSWFQQQLRPVAQNLLFAALHETGAKAIAGRDGWLFFRPDLRYLVEPDRVELDHDNSTWVTPSDGTTRGQRVLKAILHFRDQLKTRGIELLVVPVPGKPGIYPEKVTRRRHGSEILLNTHTRQLLQALNERGVATVNLIDEFQKHRSSTSDTLPNLRSSRREETHLSGATNHSLLMSTTTEVSNTRPIQWVQPTSQATELYLKTDTHWSPRGAQLAARQVANTLLAKGWIAAGSHPFTVRPQNVRRMGDIIEMMQIPGASRKYEPQTVECKQVSDPVLGLLVPTASDRPGTYKYPAGQSPVLVLGDSFCRIYQYPEPQSLGDVTAVEGQPADDRKTATTTKKLLPGSAGFISHLALALKRPVDAIVSDGGASTDVRKRLSMNPEILEGKKVVIWEFVERDISLGRAGWEEVPLPRPLD